MRKDGSKLSRVCVFGLAAALLCCLYVSFALIPLKLQVERM